jgi:hypothetical protein
MPAIDPERLNRYLGELSTIIAQPEAVIKVLDELFSFYADRTKRSSVVIQSTDTIIGYGTPSPVIRKAQQTLRASVAESEVDPMSLIQALWDSGEREMRLAAISLLADLRWPMTLEWVERMASVSRDPRVINELASQGLAGWNEVQAEDLMRLLEKWLKGPQPQLQQLGLLILLEHIDSAPHELLPDYFRLLTEAAERLQKPAQSSFHRVIKRLARWNPAETAQFLLDEGRRHNWHEPYRQLAQATVEAFPESQQREIRATLKPD